MANPLYGSNKYDDTQNSQKYVDNKQMYLSGNYHDLTRRATADSTDAKTDTGFTLVDSQIVESLWDGDGAAASMVMPSATVGVLCVFRFAAQADGGTSITFTNASGDYYEQGTICPPVDNLGVGLQVSDTAFLQSWTQSVATKGGAIVTVASTHTILTIASTATNNQTNTGAEIAWFCEKKGWWKFSFKGSELGTGAINATFATS
tara:strand:+ start:12 stop:626 length:615 start_codon:yes stop_codon:yes gene_type:complete